MNNLDIVAESMLLSDDEINTKRNGYKEIAEKEKLAFLNIKKIKNQMDGGRRRKLKIFHGYVNNNMRNRINGLRLTVIGVRIKENKGKNSTILQIKVH